MVPAWFEQLNWQGPKTIQAINQLRHTGSANPISEFPGLYAFTTHPGPLSPGNVLYIGETKQPLRRRLSGYLADFHKNYKGEKHKGRLFIWEFRNHMKNDHKIFVRWAEFFGPDDDRKILEASLIQFLNPDMNDRVEEERHPVLADNDHLPSGFFG